MQRKKPELKPEFIERMKFLLPDETDFKKYLEILDEYPVKSIRCNTLKITPEKLKSRLEKKGWKIIQPWPEIPEIMIINGDSEGNELGPGELGRALEHLLGYYYIQELASMLPVIALAPEKEEKFLDLCAAPGSKTTQAAAFMKNTGTAIANEISMGRLSILASNLERCGASNTIITKKEGSALCNKLKKQNLFFNKILIDAPCSGEGTLRSSPKTYLMWNPKNIQNLSKMQKKLVSSAIQVLEKNGEIVYSTCTHAPEENEEIIDYILKNFPELQIQEIKLPLKTRPGITEWPLTKKTFSEKVALSRRIYPHDNDTEGFFIAKFKKIKC